MSDLNRMQYYSRNDLHFSTDVPGTRQWAISLDKTMLTYFEVEPNSRFETHSHESEQITLVLEGALFFEQNEDIVEVRAGEVIAIPSNVPHAVHTKSIAAKAVDAWSPVMTKYLK